MGAVRGVDFIGKEPVLFFFDNTEMSLASRLKVLAGSVAVGGAGYAGWLKYGHEKHVSLKHGI